MSSVDGGVKIGYSMTLDLGLFLEGDSERKVLLETLFVNDEMIFERTGTLKIGKLSAIKPFLLDSSIESNSSLVEIGSEIADK